MGGVPNSSLSGDLEDETGHLRRRIGQRDLCIRGMGQEREPRRVLEGSNMEASGVVGGWECPDFWRLTQRPWLG